ncbi:MAG TPA: Gmad2 immunoglobulin-like domain-containing protein, partial [Pseudonocardia sp.]|nr:Gmad2 immunoglobulin-like domain-containing protein [Pseudonocardia sp.]
ALLVGATVAGCGSPAGSGSGSPGSAAGSVAPGSSAEASSSEPDSSPGAAAPGGGSSTAPNGAELADPEHASPGTRAVPVYYYGHTPAGDRLYREFHQVRAGAGEELGSPAVRELLARSGGVDPAYRSAWPRGWTLRAPVRRAAGVITVDLAGPVGGAAAVPSQASAALAVRQLVYTVQGALGSVDPVRILVGGQTARQLWGRVDVAAAQGRDDPYEVRSPIQIDNPGYGARVGRTFRVTGEAAVFEATLDWQVLRGPTVVQHGFATTAEGQKFSPYSFQLTLEPGTYTLRVSQEDLSGGEGRPPITDSKSITVR